MAALLCPGREAERVAVGPLDQLHPQLLLDLKRSQKQSMMYAHPHETTTVSV